MDALEKSLGLDSEMQDQQKEAEDSMDYSFKTKVRWDHVIEQQKKPQKILEELN